MRRLPRHFLVLALSGLLLGGCGLGGGAPSGARPKPSAQISHSGTPTGSSRATPRGTGRGAGPVRPWNSHPATVVALGDSITRGFDVCHPLADCPQASWATGSRPSVDSVSARLGVSGRWNLARSGAHIADLPRQARAAVAHHPAMVMVLIGANDACAANAGAMTSVADFRASFAGTLSYLHRALPATEVLVASIPDLRRLWSVGRSDVLGREVWKLGLCPAMLDDPTSDGPAATARRTAVRDRVIAYNAVLGQVCAGFTRCRYDGGAVFRYPFTAGDLSRWDWFHPNERGQHQLARVLTSTALTPPPSP